MSDCALENHLWKLSAQSDTGEGRAEPGRAEPGGLSRASLAGRAEPSRAGAGPSQRRSGRARHAAGPPRSGCYFQVSERLSFPSAPTVAVRFAPDSQTAAPEASTFTYLYSKLVPAGRSTEPVQAG